ncbi:MAG: hypothetical protein HUJ76_13250, partial [Parasporobacterium sp.]|nr:hypothetical protein [Parasporobacterium sp.]
MLSVLLSLVLALSMLPLSVFADETKTFEKVYAAAVEDGGNYLLVAHSSDGSDFAVKAEGDSLTSQPVIVSNDTISVNDEELIWTASASDEDSAVFTNGGRSISRNGTDISLSSTEPVQWDYDGSALTSTQDSYTYYFRYIDGSFLADTVSGENVVLYKLVTGPASDIPEEQNILEETAVPEETAASDEADAAEETVTEEAAAPEELGAGLPSQAADGTVYVAFTSDVHNKTGDASVTRLDSWINTVTQSLGTKFDIMGITGDLGPSDGGQTESVFWSEAQKVINKITNNANVVNNGFYICGNHEWSPGNFSTTSNSTKQYYSTAGTYYEGNGYILYSVGATQSGAQYTDTTKNALRTFLEAHADYAG